MLKRIGLHIFLYFVLISASAQTHLSKVVELDKRYKNAIELLDTLAKRTSLQFSYQSKLISKPINIRKGKKTIQDIIDYICVKNSVEYKLINSTVIIKSKQVGSSKKARVISGKIIEDSTGEAVPFAYLYIENSSIFYKSNRFGYFSFIAPPRDTFNLFCVGSYESAKQIKITKSLDSFLVVVMPRLRKIRKVKVKSKKNTSLSDPNKIGTIRISQKKLTEIPAFLGEHDILNALALSPGVTKGTEGNNGLFIRGGSPDQNLITLDGALLYNPNHFFGIFSPFNSDAIRNVSMQKSGFDASTGGRLSSHLAIDLKEGNIYQHEHSFSISPIAISGSSNGPIKSPKTTYLVSLRRSYFDLAFTPLINTDENSIGFYFFDLNAKLTHNFNSKNKVSLSLFSFRDKAFNDAKFSRSIGLNKNNTEENSQSLSWGNNLAQLNYKGQIRKNLFLNSNIYYTSFKYKNQISYKSTTDSSGGDIISVTDNAYNFNSDVFSISTNHNFTWRINSKLKSKLGLGYFYHSFLPSSSEFTSLDTTLTALSNNNKVPKIFANETYAYADLAYKPNNFITLEGGLRFSSYHTTTANYFNPQPRFSAKIALPKSSYIKASVGRAVQYLHYSTNNTIGLPVDLWLPVTKNLDPESSNQYSLQFQKFGKHINLNTELFYKTFDNLIEYAEGIEYLGNSSSWESKFVQGTGQTYGIDVMLEKKIGQYKGWIGYTWSVNNRQFDSINNGEAFPFKYDRRNSISLTLSKTLKSGINFYSSWVYGSGSAITLPVGRYPSANSDPQQDIYIYGKRNENRMRDYHKLDIGIKSSKIKKHYTRIWNFSIYNIYNRQNPYYITPGTDDDGNRAFIQVSLLPILPSISYRIEIN